MAAPVAHLPMLTLGIPGDGNRHHAGRVNVTGMQPGPLMFTDHGDMVYTLFVGMIFCYFMLLVLDCFFESHRYVGENSRQYSHTDDPRTCVVGLVPNNSPFDVGIMLIAA